MSGYSNALHAQHAQMLAESGVSPGQAAARGYVTVDTKKRLADLGISKAGQNVPGMLVPMLGIDGTPWGHQYRPDAPRLRDGKTVKYETPVGQRNAIDVPPGVADQLDDPGVPLWITEGVKKADAAAERGLCCIALAGVWGWRATNEKAGKTALADWHDIALNGRLVVLAFDSDVVVKTQVRAALKALAAYLASKGAKVRYLHMPHDGGGKTGLDDYLAENTVASLEGLVRADEPAGRSVKDDKSGLTALSALSAQPLVPMLAEEALQGLPGRVVRAVEPYTEADPAAVLLTFLATAGAMLGKDSYVLAGDAEHGPRIWPMIVGKTAGGMKGTSLGPVKRIALAADEAFSANIVGGLTSGEGLIERVRDSDGDPEDKNFVEGVEDKRLLVIETEFAGVIGRAKREGNTLSQIQRQAWDGDRLATMARKTNRLCATNPHIVVIAHITPTELLAKLSDSDVGGGLMNRYLPVYSHRSKKMPGGGSTPDTIIKEFGAELRESLDRANKTAGQIDRDTEAEVLWFSAYDGLTAEVPDGLVAAVIARAVPQVLRLSLIYALLDEQGDRACIRVEHVAAALAVWNYVEASARLVFGDAAANGDLNLIAAAIRDAGTAGLTRTKVYELFSHHKGHDALDELLRQLLVTGGFRAITEPTKGRPTTRYFVVERDKRSKRQSSADRSGQPTVETLSTLSTLITHSPISAEPTDARLTEIPVGPISVGRQEMGFCAKCGKPIHRYGADAKSTLCEECAAHANAPGLAEIATTTVSSEQQLEAVVLRPVVSPQRVDVIGATRVGASAEVVWLVPAATDQKATRRNVTASPEHATVTQLHSPTAAQVVEPQDVEIEDEVIEDERTVPPKTNDTDAAVKFQNDVAGDTTVEGAGGPPPESAQPQLPVIVAEECVCTVCGTDRLYNKESRARRICATCFIKMSTLETA